MTKPGIVVWGNVRGGGASGCPSSVQSFCTRERTESERIAAGEFIIEPNADAKPRTADWAIGGEGNGGNTSIESDSVSVIDFVCVSRDCDSECVLRIAPFPPLGVGWVSETVVVGVSSSVRVGVGTVLFDGVASIDMDSVPFESEGFDSDWVGSDLDLESEGPESVSDSEMERDWELDSDTDSENERESDEEEETDSVTIDDGEIDSVSEIVRVRHLSRLSLPAFEPVYLGQLRQLFTVVEPRTVEYVFCGHNRQVTEAVSFAYFPATQVCCVHCWDNGTYFPKPALIQLVEADARLEYVPAAQMEQVEYPVVGV
jgi:hypothetical protein